MCCVLQNLLAVSNRCRVKHATYNRVNTQNKAVHYTKFVNHSMKMHLQCGKIFCFV